MNDDGARRRGLSAARGIFFAFVALLVLWALFWVIVWVIVQVKAP